MQHFCRLGCALAAAVSAALTPVVASAQPCTPAWLPEFAPSGVNVGGTNPLEGCIAGVVLDHDGAGPNSPVIYVGGFFQPIYDNSIDSVASWDGRSWSSMGGGLYHEVRAMVAFDDGSGDGPKLYVGGTYPQFNGHAAFWKDSSWEPLPDPLTRRVNSMAVFDDGQDEGPALYMASVAGGVIRWDGQAATRVGQEDAYHPGGEVFRLVVLDLDGPGPGAAALYAASRAGEREVAVSRWDGESWEAVGAWPPSATVRALEVFDPDGEGPEPRQLYAGGSFFELADGAPAAHLARWDGTRWHAVGSGTSGWVRALRVFDDGQGEGLYVGGDFQTIDGVQSRGVARFDGQNFSPAGTGVLGGSMNNYGVVHDLLPYEDESGPALLVLGRFFGVDGLWARGAALWTGASWRRLGAEAPTSETLFATGGSPDWRLITMGTSAATSRRSQLGAWDGETWRLVGDFFTERLFTALRWLDVGDGAGNSIYSASHPLISGPRTFRVYRFTNDGWVTIGEALTGSATATVSDLAAFRPAHGGPTQVIAAGVFDAAGGVAAANIAAWDGAAWSPLGPGLTGGTSPSVSVLTVFDDGSGPALYAAGNFTHAGPLQVNGVARWDGAAWQAVGAGFLSADGNPGRVLAFAPSAGDAGRATLYAGGSFASSGGTPMRNVARWNGQSWEALGDGVSGNVVSLALFDDDGLGPQLPALFVAGTFAEAGGVAVRNMARWDGQEWSALSGNLAGGNGVSWPTIHRLGAVERSAGQPALVASGFFYRAAEWPVSRLALYGGCPRCPADADNDGAISSGDIAAFLMIWLGSEACSPCEADFNGDGVTNSTDVGAFLDAWLAAATSGC